MGRPSARTHPKRRRSGLRLAFVRVVQVLPPRQRAALILHNVLVKRRRGRRHARDHRGRDQRRTRHDRAPARASSATSALAPRHAEVVDRFLRAWESGDFDDFVALLATDAVMSVPPWEYWHVKDRAGNPTDPSGHVLDGYLFATIRYFSPVDICAHARSVARSSS
jgi:hypothetical protein